MKVKEKCKLIKKEMLTDDIYKFSVKTNEIAKLAKPGQFLEIKVSETGEPFLRRPISIFNIENDVVEFIFQVKGRGTELLSNMKEESEIDIIGPLGNGSFEVKKYNNVAVIGGGIGTYPLYELTKELQENANINVYLGFRDKSLVTCEKDFENLKLNKLVITTDDGSYKEKGFAIDFLKKIMKKISLI